MRRPHIKNFSIALITSALALSLTACAGAGPDAATRMIKRVTDGNEAIVKTNGNDLSISNLLLVATEDGSAVVVGTIVTMQMKRMHFLEFQQVAQQRQFLANRTLQRISQFVLKVIQQMQRLYLQALVQHQDVTSLCS